MEDLPDCFTKWYFVQHPEVEVTTIRCLINNGFKSKMSLQVMDLERDLPQMTTMTLGQRAIIRVLVHMLQKVFPYINEDAY